MQIPDPPTWLLWIATVSSLTLVALQIYNFYRTRWRVVMRQIVGQRYYTTFTESQAKPWGVYFVEPEAGDPRIVFTVLEFTITNNHAHAISVGRIMIGNWIYADQYARGVYDLIRDYRVYDLFTGERISLATYVTLQQGQIAGYRVEMYEFQGDRTTGTVRVALEMPSHYELIVSSDIRIFDFKLRVVDSQQINESDLKNIYRWSGLELIREEPIDQAIFPQGLIPPWEKHRMKLVTRFRAFIGNKVTQARQYLGRT